MCKGWCSQCRMCRVFPEPGFLWIGCTPSPVSQGVGCSQSPLFPEPSVSPGVGCFQSLLYPKPSVSPGDGCFRSPVSPGTDVSGVWCVPRGWVFLVPGMSPRGLSVSGVSPRGLGVSGPQCVPKGARCFRNPVCPRGPGCFRSPVSIRSLLCFYPCSPLHKKTMIDRSGFTLIHKHTSMLCFINKVRNCLH